MNALVGWFASADNSALQGMFLHVGRRHRRQKRRVVERERQLVADTDILSRSPGKSSGGCSEPAEANGRYQTPAAHYRLQPVLDIAHRIEP